MVRRFQLQILISVQDFTRNLLSKTNTKFQGPEVLKTLFCFGLISSGFAFSAYPDFFLSSADFFPSSWNFKLVFLIKTWKSKD